MKIITLTDLRKDLFKIIMAKKEYHHLIQQILGQILQVVHVLRFVFPF